MIEPIPLVSVDHRYPPANGFSDLALQSGVDVKTLSAMLGH